MEEQGNRTIHLYYIYGIIGITIILLILRVVFYFSGVSRFAFLRDVDYMTLHDLMDNGVVNYYKESTIGGFRAIYLYYWYFMFYPFYIIPLEIGLYVWDMLRLLTTIYIAKNIYKITENSVDIVLFFILSGIGYFADMYLNNTNWLIQFLLFQSYLELKKDRKWLSGLLFSLAVFKINVIIFPFILLISRKIKIKDLRYFFLPLAILCIPYILFPDYFSQLLYNWTYVESECANANLIIVQLYIISWQAFQPAQLMYISLMISYLIENIKNERWQNRLRIGIFLFLIILNLSFPLVLWQIC